MMPVHYYSAVDKLIDLALAEDVGGGDITTDNLLDPQTQARGDIVAKNARQIR